MNPSPSVRSILRRLFSALLIAALLTPVLIPNDFWSAIAKAPRDRNLSAAPESRPHAERKRRDPILSLRSLFAATVARSIISVFGSTDARNATKAKDGNNAAGETDLSKRSKSDVNSETTENEASEIEGESDSAATEVAALSPPPPAAAVDFDFDGDGKSDLSRWHAASTEFKSKNSTGGSYQTYTTVGTSSDSLAPADYDGDGITDVATFNSGTWKIRTSSNSTVNTVSSFGQSGDIPVSGDYRSTTGDELAIFRPSNSTWYWREMGSGTVYSQTWGTSGDVPVGGDFDGDGKMDPAIFRPSTGYWYWTLSGSSSNSSASWGQSGDVPIAGDYDGDGKTDLTVFRPSTGIWYVKKSSTSFATWSTQTWGNYNDQPVAGDFDGDGTSDYAIWRPSSGAWYVIKSSNSSFIIDTLGAPGDVAVASSYVQQVGSGVDPDQIAQARLSPKNATGGSNLYSQNFSWGRQLVSLPGRSGLDLGLGISYNSLVWTKVGSTMFFDPDYSNVSPGFRLDFPTIEPAYYDDATGKYNYLMITPGGARIQFRQTAVSNVYETVDSSYLQIVTDGEDDPNDPLEGITITMTSTDGTKMAYEWKGGAYRCNKIKDRNGNYISISYDSLGLLQSMTDTLGRTVTVNYDAYSQPSTIKQNWRDDNGHGDVEEHTYATFGYTTKTVATDFDGLTVWGPPNDWNVRVLDRVTYADESFTKFSYNGYVQVYKIENHAPNSTGGTPHPLNHVRTDIESPGADQTDCPRFTQTWNKAENFNSGSETTTTITKTASDEYTPPGADEISATKIEVAMDSDPYNTVSKIWVAESGWQEGLVLASEDWADGVSSLERKRWSWSYYTQDDTGVAYKTNPRMFETRVGDGTNTKRTTLTYLTYLETTIAMYGLVGIVNVYDTNLSTVLKSTEIEYELNSAYTSRRILGLPKEVEVSGKDQLANSFGLVSRTTFLYDQGDFSDTEDLDQQAAPYHHDTAYDDEFITGRGNLTNMTRWDATQPTTSGAAISSSQKYNIAGSVVSMITPWDGTNTRTTRIGYTDSFNSSPGVSTYAYPTTFTDAAGSELGDEDHSSFVKYRYDIGANVEALSPAPDGRAHGKMSRRTYDNKGRLAREAILTNVSDEWGEYSYTRYSRPSPDTGVEVSTFTTVVDNDNDGADADDEVQTVTSFDGAGRVLKVRTEHPGSTGGWSGLKTEYDILGRAYRQTVPTEIESDWDIAGDDVTRGWVWNTSEFDWKGRTTRSIPSDSNGSDGKDTLISYAGCGCAGQVATTVLGPLVPTDVDPGTNARRKTKIYEDILGRRASTETFAWDGTTVYSTVVNLFNGRDQVLSSKRYIGTTSGDFQENRATFDGHGRLVSSHRPEQMDSEENPLSTTYSYYPDGSISTVVDARGAVTNTTYNVLGLPVERASVMPTPTPDPSPTPTPTPSPTPSPTPPPYLNPSVTYEYDNLGNRTGMTDLLGSVEYEYNDLGQMTSETRAFTDSMTYAPIASNKFKLEYEYTLSGQLKWYQDPFGEQITHAFDHTGRLTDITGSTFGGVTSYADGATYRAWGGLEQSGYGSGIDASVEYNSRLQVSAFSLDDAGDDPILDKEYSYYPDGKLGFMHDIVATKFDRLNRYDSIGKISIGLSGGEARGETVAENQRAANLPYRQSYEFDVFGNLTESDNMHWGKTDFGGMDFDRTFDYDNNRVQEENWTFDADGRITFRSTNADNIGNLFDASGRVVQEAGDLLDSTISYDGDGLEVRRQSEEYDSGESTWEARPTKYYIRSTILGGRVISEVWANGRKHRSFVKGIGNETAIQSEYPEPSATPDELVLFEFSDSSGMSYRTTDKLGDAASTGNGGEGAPIETDPLGGNVGTHTPYFAFVGGGAFHSDYSSHLLQFSNPRDFTGGQDFGSLYSIYGSRVADLPGFGTNWGSFGDLGMIQQDERAWNSQHGRGFNTNEELSELIRRQLGIDIYIQPGAHVTGFGVNTANGDKVGGTWDFDRALAVAQDGGVSLFATWDDSGSSSSATSVKSACQKMVEKLQWIVDDKVKALGGRGALSNHDLLDKLGKAIADSLYNAYVLELNSTSTAATKGPPGDMQGETGFKREFWEVPSLINPNPNVDQTHHFAAFFSAGVHGRNFKAWMHDTFFENSEGDYNLSKAAYGLGERFMETRVVERGVLFGVPVSKVEQASTRRDRMLAISNTVRGKICDY